MPGTRITDEQVRLYMNNRKTKSQVVAAAKAGISERSARSRSRDERSRSPEMRGHVAEITGHDGPKYAPA